MRVAGPARAARRGAGGRHPRAAAPSAAAGAACRRATKSSGTSVRPRASTAARSSVFSSSRTLPGQGWRISSSRASGATPTIVGAEVAVHLVDEELDQLGDVAAPLAQRRHDDAARRSGGRRDPRGSARARTAPLQVLVGGGDDADVGADGLAAADAGELALLQDAQQLRLQVERHVADLVEEERAAGRGLELADAALDGAGEGAALVAEQLALEQLVAGSPSS